MGCGCGSRNINPMRRNVRQLNPNKVASANINSKRELTKQEKLAEERRISEKNRRDHILKLLNSQP